MRLLALLLKFAFGILCIIGTIGFASAGMLTFKIQSANHLLQLGIGAGMFFLTWIFFLSRRDSFWSVVEHELTHAVFALMFFKKVRALNADRRRGGLVKVEGGNFVIALAPYFFPLLSVFLILVKPLVLTNYQWILNGLLGFTLMFHLLYLFGEFHPSQPDLQETGFLFSAAVIIFFNLFFIGLSLASLSGQWGPMGVFIQSGFWESYELLKSGWIFFESNFLSNI
jgi:hypothetical protein